MRIDSILSWAEAWLPPFNVPPAGHPPFALPWRLINLRRYTNALDAICTSGTRLLMPDAEWHEQTYQSRDQTALPLEPGHQFFLLDPKAPSMDDCSISVAAWEIFLRRRVILGSKLRALN